MSNSILSQTSLAELFKKETEEQCGTILLALERMESSPEDLYSLEQIMRGAHALKGAAKLVDAPKTVTLLHAVETYIIGLQERSQPGTEMLFAALYALTDLLLEKECATSSSELYQNLLSFFNDGVPFHRVRHEPSVQFTEGAASFSSDSATSKQDSVIRVSAHDVAALLAQSGECVVAQTRLERDLEKLQSLRTNIKSILKRVTSEHNDVMSREQTRYLLNELQEALKIVEHDSRTISISLEEQSSNLGAHVGALYRSILHSRMRPMSDIEQTMRRTARDAAQMLGKEIEVHFTGMHTKIDREALQVVESAIIQVIKNAVDHGIESASDRTRSGKPVSGTIKITARSTSRSSTITISDDGGGISVASLKKRIVALGLTTAEVAEELTEAEILEFIFLPGFSSKEETTVLSGRGVGLDVVQTTMRSLRGDVRVVTHPGKGTTFELTLPISFAVNRCLIATTASSVLAFPLTSLTTVLRASEATIIDVGSSQCLAWDGQHIPLLNARQVFTRSSSDLSSESPFILVCSCHSGNYAFTVDAILSEEEVVLQSIPAELGTIFGTSAVTTTRDGHFAYVVHTEDVGAEAQRMLSAQEAVLGVKRMAQTTKRRAVLVVDDSLTVRELERSLLEQIDCDVTVAVDGVDGLHQSQVGNFDLIVTDIDMPRMSGFELVEALRKNKKTSDTPVIIVSYKEREEDRQKGLEVGADYYLTKGSFHDQGFIQAVQDHLGDTHAT
jgi:two-component system sensor histidine kinase and response regulator WspE